MRIDQTKTEQNNLKDYLQRQHQYNRTHLL